MLICADWVVPVGDRPIKDGAVLVRGGLIAEVGNAARMQTSHPDARVYEFPGCVAMPGLVNAHTHLALTSLKGVIPSMQFPEWITQVPIAMGALSPDDIAASISHGALKSIASGTTAIGDIAYGPESICIAADTGLGGAFFWEVLGITRDELAQHLYDREYPSDPGTGCTVRLRCGLSPHAPYTSGPELIQAIHTIASAQHSGFAIHAAESEAETHLLGNGGGPLADVAGRLAHGFRPVKGGVIRYLDKLGALDDAILVHCTKTLPTDIPIIARSARGIVMCPRSNEYLHNGKPAAWKFEQAAIPLALGTDSLASNEDLDLFEEARALRAIEPRFDARRLVEMMTWGGAKVLGIEAHFGELATDKQADIAVFRVPSGDDPYAALLDHAGRHTVEAVLSSGVWRVLNAAPTLPVSVIERASHLATQRAALAVHSEII